MRAQIHHSGLISPTQSGLPSFRLYRPHNLQEAQDVITTDPEAIVISGGTDFFAQTREGLRPKALVTVRRIPELTAISFKNKVLKIGAGATHSQGQNDSTLREALPSFADAWGSIATVRLRRTATIGGNLMAQRYRYEVPLLTSALDANLEFFGGRSRPVEWLWDEKPGTPERLLTDITIDTEDLLFFGYERSMRPLATLALTLRRSQNRLIVRAVAGSEYRPGFILQLSVPERNPEDIHIAEVAAGIAEQLPTEAADYSGSHAYRRHLIEVLTTRLLRQEQHNRLMGRN